MSEDTLAVFSPTAEGVCVRFSDVEHAVLTDVFSQALQLLVLTDSPQPSGEVDELMALVGMRQGPVKPPEDPALARLFPDAYADDPAAAGEFRRFTEGELRHTKKQGLQRVLDSLTAPGQALTFPAELALDWLRALADVRLVVGTRLGITDDDDSDQPDEDRQAGFALYDYLTFLQETLVESLPEPPVTPTTPDEVG